ncbi:class I SAM-dependent methyltransferase [uncultured Clostridium sp.]|uniref:class I SAM-dependent methyltransferase n=1 Tax=uncultured Clostridium sp. TaxID=59620 RepID=UPI0026077DB0|nr:rRNA adenine N-6-methyltransferase family protein [uncultured Clostridium sp.]
MNINFLIQYITHPRVTGAVLPSSKRLAFKMIENINFNTCNCIIELGPGTGVFTDEILKKRNDDTIFILIEYNEDFYKKLKSKYSRIKNIYIVNDSAENIDYYIKRYNINSVDYIVSGLPFASLPKDMSENILNKCKYILKNKGTFITFQYTKFKKDLIKKYFREIKLSKEILNLPPAYVFTCKNE